MSKPTDPNVVAHRVVEQATGTQAPAPTLPPHFLVEVLCTDTGKTAERVRCERCGQTFDLSKREGERAAEMRAFASIHAHED